MPMFAMRETQQHEPRAPNTAIWYQALWLTNMFDAKLGRGRLEHQDRNSIPLTRDTSVPSACWLIRITEEPEMGNDLRESSIKSL